MYLHGNMSAPNRRVSSLTRASVSQYTLHDEIGGVVEWETMLYESRANVAYVAYCSFRFWCSVTRFVYHQLLPIFS